MRSILIVFMTTYMVTKMGTPDRMGDAEARGYFSMFVSAVYFLPILGAILAECFLGKYNTIFWLSLVYCAGHFALALNDTRVGLMIGLGNRLVGGIKPCVSANVGNSVIRASTCSRRSSAGFYFRSMPFILTIALSDPQSELGPRYFGLPGIAIVIRRFFSSGRAQNFVHIPPADSAS
jgi:POT family proton-dependent oligopeptide transporter